MQADPSASSGARHVGAVAALWRYPVKSMMGEELNSCEVTGRGFLGDRQFAVVDRATGKVGGAKNPRKWGNFFDFRASLRDSGCDLGLRRARDVTKPVAGWDLVVLGAPIYSGPQCASAS